MTVFWKHQESNVCMASESSHLGFTADISKEKSLRSQRTWESESFKSILNNFILKYMKQSIEGFPDPNVHQSLEVPK